MSNYYISDVTSNGDYTTDKVNDRDERFYLSIVFYSDESLTTAVTPSNGTVNVYASETMDQYGHVGEIAAPDAGVDSTYDRLAFSGSIQSVKVTLADIAGASHFRFKIGGYE